MEQPSDDRIRERARLIWEREGRPHGRSDEHWRRAQEELNDELQHNVDRAVPDREHVAGGNGNPISRVVERGGEAPVTPDILKDTR